MKRGNPADYEMINKKKHEAVPKDEDNTFNCPQSAIGEIKMITGGPSIGESFKFLKKS